MEIHKFSQSLTGKLIRLLTFGLLVWLLLFLILFVNGTRLLKLYLSSQVGQAQSYSLQQYVRRKRIAATDIRSLRDWTRENAANDWIAVREDTIVFSSFWKTKFLAESREESSYSYNTVHVVTFADGEADVYIYEDFPHIYSCILFIVSLLAGGIVCMGIFSSELREQIQYIQYLKNEVEAIGAGNLKTPIRVRGEDELAQLAAGVDQMRETLCQHRQREQELQAAQKKLVLGMSHDLRTPLTGLLTYMELLKRSLPQEERNNEYVTKIYGKIFQIRDLSDKMFEHFFIRSDQPISLEEPEEIAVVLGDYLSELCVTLEYEGFSVNAEKLVWRPAQIRINTNFLGRILNNLTSNLLKYGERSQEVHMEIFYRETEAGVCLANAVSRAAANMEGTGIGLSNVSTMMERMGGHLEVRRTEKDFQAVLYFPLVPPAASEHQE